MSYDFINPKHYNGHNLKIKLENGATAEGIYETIDLIDSLGERLEKIGVPHKVSYKILNCERYLDRIAGCKPDGEKTIFQKMAEDLRKISWYALRAADELDNTKIETEERKIKKIYISGAISSDPNWINKFKAAELELKERFQGITVITPILTEELSHDDNVSYEDFMTIDFALIDVCDAVYFLEDWNTSPGAVREYEYVTSWNEKNQANKKAVYFERVV